MSTAVVGPAAASWPLVGRAEELAFVEEALAHPDCAGVVVSGQAGVGKTRLAREALASASRGASRPVWAAATEAGRAIPFGSLAHLLPAELPSTLSRHDAVQVLAAALTERAEGGRLVVGVDDAHLLDVHSALLLHHLSQAGAASVIATVRSGAPAPDHPMRASVKGLLRLKGARGPSPASTSFVRWGAPR